MFIEKKESEWLQELSYWQNNDNQWLQSLNVKGQVWQVGKKYLPGDIVSASFWGAVTNQRF